MTTNDFDTFITASPDSKATHGTTPAKAGTIAEIEYRLLSAQPYGLTSDELLFEVEAERKAIAANARDAARAAFLAKSHACLRASPLVKTHGFGLHHDGAGRVALYGRETDAYKAFIERSDLKVIAGMRSARS
jgi:hypothetical protein